MNYKAVYCSHPTLTRHCSQFDIIFSQLVKAPTTTVGVLSVRVVSIRYSECERERERGRGRGRQLGGAAKAGAISAVRRHRLEVVAGGVSHSSLHWTVCASVS